MKQSSSFPKVSVVVPARNEAANLPVVFGGIDPSYEVILVDGNSVDDTVEVARRLRPDVKVVGQTRKGKGNALACGFAAATGEIIVMLDADGSAEPREIPRFVRTLVEGADFAKGTRFSIGGGSSDITRLRRLGNKALNGLVNAAYGTRYSDLCYGYNAFWRYCLPVIGVEPGEPGADMLWGDGFEIETLINIRIASAGLRVVEVPSFEACRIHGVSNLNAVTDGLRVLRTIGAEKRRMHAPLEISRHTSFLDVTVPEQPANHDEATMLSVVESSDNSSDNSSNNVVDLSEKSTVVEMRPMQLEGGSQA